MKRFRKAFAWLFLLLSFYGALMLFAAIRARKIDGLWVNHPGYDSPDVERALFVIAVSTGISFVLFIARTASKAPVEDMIHDSPTSDVGGPDDGFDVSSLHRQQIDFGKARPELLRGRIRDIRRWKEEGRFWGRSDVIGFHLNYDRTQRDFGDVIVRLNRDYFGNLKLEEGDDLELALLWKTPFHVALVNDVQNYSSGQSFKPRRAGKKAAIVEAI